MIEERPWLSELLSADAGYTLKGSAGFFLLQGISFVLSFLLNYILIKAVGATEYGQYVYLFNLLAIVAGFCVAGTDTLLIQKNPIYKESGQYSLLKGVITFSLIVTLTISLIAGGVCNIIYTRTGFSGSLDWYTYLGLFFFVLPFMSLLILLQSSFRGFKKIFLSQVAEKLIRPGLMIVIAGTLLLTYKRINFSEIVQSGMIAVTVSFLIIFAFHNRYLATSIQNADRRFAYKDWIKPAISFFILDSLFLLNSRLDIFLLGILSNSKTVGDYNIVLKLSEIISFGLFTANLIIAPLIAKIYFQKDLQKLQNLITLTSRFTAITALLPGILILCFNGSILAFFGIHSVNSQIALVILCFGQFINVFLGSVGILLSMSGHQKLSILGLVISIIVTIALNIVLIPIYDIIGVAIASATGLAAWNIIMYFFVRKKLGIRTTAFAAF